jgi:hypothetical protein
LKREYRGNQINQSKSDFYHGRRENIEENKYINQKGVYIIIAEVIDTQLKISLKSCLHLG